MPFFYQSTPHYNELFVCRTPTRKKLFSSPPSVAKTRRILNAHNIGDLDVIHFSTPKRAGRHLKMVKKIFYKNQMKTHILRKQLNRLKNKVKSYEDLIMALKNKQLLSENAADQLQVSF